MSNALTIASVSSVLKGLLDNGIARHDLRNTLGDVAVTVLPPDRVPIGTEERPQLNLFLYRVTPNTAWRRQSAPSASIDENGYLSPLVLDLHYLLAAYGEQDFQAEILLGMAVQMLHESPVLDHEAIRAVVGPNGDAGGDGSPAREAIRGSQVLDGLEQIRIVPEFLDMDEASKLWSVLQAKYRPSVHYRVTMTLAAGEG